VATVAPPVASTELELNAAVIPLGNPVADKRIGFASPLATRFRESGTGLPACTLIAVDAGRTCKDGEGTLTWMATDDVALPDVPVITMLKVPTDAVVVGVMVTTLVPVLVMLVGEKVRFTPEGTPDAESTMSLDNPAELDTPIVLGTPGPPTKTVALDSDEERLKVGAATVMLIVVLSVIAPEVPWMVIV